MDTIYPQNIKHLNSKVKREKGGKAFSPLQNLGSFFGNGNETILEIGGQPGSLTRDARGSFLRRGGLLVFVGKRGCGCSVLLNERWSAETEGSGNSV